MEERHQQKTEGDRHLNMNVYATKKTFAMGIMDIALLSANANQLKYVLKGGPEAPHYLVNVVLISTSITLQIIMGLVIVWLGKMNVNEDKTVSKANKVNNVVVTIIIIITVLNILIPSFGIGEPPQPNTTVSM
ncbi:unnamed protein product [Darwinula stevensoni]|uniref:Ninjurin-1-like n=1 Tax=Darwinula stevensoni TaxID=69355 RepID=A0A7R9AHM3_9CRUS|nr:unnamed protein product [Darwinula stevensoni]CAG0905145.1 unnamed protein product [Darwinula stevensoni]